MSQQAPVEKLRVWAEANKGKIATAVGVLSWLVIRHVGEKIRRRRKRYPPGKVGLRIPIIGGILAFRNPFHQLRVWAREGPVTLVDVGTQQWILVSTAEAARHILKGRHFLARPGEDFMRQLAGEYFLHVGAVNGDNWMRRRKIIQASFLRVLTSRRVDELAGNSLRRVVLPQLDELAKTRDAFSPREVAEHVAIQSVFSVAFGKPVDPSWAHRFAQLTTQMSDSFLRTRFLVAAMPFLMRFNVQHRLKELAKEMFQMLDGELRARKAVHEGKPPEAFVDYLLQHIAAGEIKWEEAVCDLSILFQGGFDTTATSLQFGVALAALQPDVQDQIYEELKATLRGEVYELHDEATKECHLLHAFVHDVLRVTTPNPMGGFRVVPEECEVTAPDKDGIPQDYVLPRGSTIVLNIDIIQRGLDLDAPRAKRVDLNNWLSPDENGRLKFDPKKNLMAAFGVGRRDCVGKPLAMKHLKIVLGTMLLRYKFEPGNPGQEIERHWGTAVRMSEFPVLITRRADKA